ncbi:MAG TPA: class F sortase [Candidatus Paceibacterota bacterium]|nr:class F sortase [Candidatus Paceibacterota bacterium]
MRNQLINFAIGVVTLGAAGAFVLILVHALWYAPEEEAAVVLNASTTPGVPQSAASSSISAPIPHDTGMRLRIPAIGVDAAIQDVGIGKTGNMAVPTNYTDVGWYRYGTKIGDAGSAVMDGHVDNGFALAAVFKNLDQLKAGDDIYVDKQDGTTLHFKVEEADDYPAADVPLQQLFNRNDGQARLNLITCAGEWDSSAEAYDHRTVVYAVLV